MKKVLLLLLVVAALLSMTAVIHTVTAAETATVASRTASDDFKISGAYLNLTDNVNLFYTATVPEGYEDPYMVFEMNGKSYKVTDYTVRTDGKLSFSFGAIRAQYFGDSIKATLYATYDGVLCSAVK